MRSYAGSICLFGCWATLMTAGAGPTARAEGDAPASDIPRASCEVLADSASVKLLKFYLSGNELVFGEAVVARGNVEFRYDGYVLTADEISLDRSGGPVAARGNVRLAEPRDKMTYGESLVLSDDLADGFRHYLGCAMYAFRAVRGVLPTSLRR